MNAAATPAVRRILVAGATPAVVHQLASALGQALDSGNAGEHLQADITPFTDAAPLGRALGAAGALTCLLLAPDPQEEDVTARLAQESADALLRATLAQHGQSFRVIHGADDAGRLAHALRALQVSPVEAAPSRPWVWNCEKCSDPACEHQLFRRLAGGDSAH